MRTDDHDDQTPPIPEHDPPGLHIYVAITDTSPGPPVIDFFDNRGSNDGRRYVDVDHAFVDSDHDDNTLRQFLYAWFDRRRDLYEAVYHDSTDEPPDGDAA